MKTKQSEAMRFEYCFSFKRYREEFCTKTLIIKVKKACTSSEPWGGDDTMYRFADGSMLLWRDIVKEFQLFKP